MRFLVGRCAAPLENHNPKKPWAIKHGSGAMVAERCGHDMQFESGVKKMVHVKAWIKLSMQHSFAKRLRSTCGGRRTLKIMRALLTRFFLVCHAHMFLKR